MDGVVVLSPRHISKVFWNEELSKVFDKLYRDSGKSIRGIAKEANVPHTHVDKLKRNKKTETDYQTLKQILKAMGASEEDLFDHSLVGMFKPGI